MVLTILLHGLEIIMQNKIKYKESKLAIIGLGYVGLPLAVEFGKNRSTVGYDINTKRIKELKSGIDKTSEILPNELLSAKKLSFSSDLKEIESAKIFIITVPTPIDKNKNPDLGPLESASRSVGKILKKGDIVIYESTVYPGATEEVCIPILEDISGLKFNTDFFCGYSPERINPGDKNRRLSSIIKITSGSSMEVADIIDDLYSEIISAGTYKAQSIKVAEAAKVIENTQRDLNIALMNELAMLFNRLEIDTQEVLKAAGTKWNFLQFEPGLVGGHCIGVDPYYLTHKASSVGFHSDVILAGRKTNDGMGSYIANEFIKRIIEVSGINSESKVLVMGLTFKENCPDLRNSKVFDVIKSLENFGITVDVYDPQADPLIANEGYGIKLINNPKKGFYDGLILAVAHECFKNMTVDSIRSYGKKNHVFYDIKSIFKKDDSDLRL